MNKFISLILAVLVSLLIYLSVSNLPSEKDTFIVARAIDGDTLETADGQSIRLLNINSPEKNTLNSELSYSILKSLEDTEIKAEVTGTDKYGRILARLYSPNYINLYLVEEGAASKFLVQEDELTDFSNAEKNAIENEKGIWKKSPYFGCFESDIDYNKEVVLLKINCSDLKTEGLFLKDESRKTYNFPETNSKILFLHSSKGINNETDLFWNTETNVWNNDRDSLYIFDKEGKIVHYSFYGY